MARSLPGWLGRRADNVAVLLLSATFLIFILQIASRYLFRAPLGWTLEACLMCWVWLVFWSGAFTLRNQDHVRFTILVDAAGPRIRRIFALLSALCIVTAMGISLWPTIDFVRFMASESTSLLKVRFAVFFSIYVVFSIAVILRYTRQAWLALRGTLDT